MIHSKSLKRALAFLMVIVIMFVTIFTDNVVKRVLVRAGDNVEAGSGGDGEDANPSANPSAKPDEGTGEDETKYPVLGEDINNSGTYNNYSNGEIKILLDLDKLTNDDTKAAIENAGEITSVKYSINLEERNAVKKDENDNKKWIITIPEYEEENSSGNITYVINQIKVNDTIELNEFSAYSLNVTRNTVAPKIKLSYGVKELNDGDSILNNDDIALNIKAIDENGDELKSTDEDGNESNAYDVQWKLLKDNGEDIQMKPAITKDTENGGFNTVLSKEDGKTHKFELTLNVTDIWGNSSEISATAVIDNVTPEMNINEKSSDNSGKRVFEVTVSDDQNLYSNFENEKDDLNKLVSVLDDSKNEVTDAEISAEESSENNVVKYKVSFSNNENTTYSIKVKDLAGNDKSSQLDTFELKDLTGLSDAETTYIGKDGKDVSFKLSEEVASVEWRIDEGISKPVDGENNTYTFKLDISTINDADEHLVYIVIKKDSNTYEKKYSITVDKDAPTVKIVNNDSNSWVNIANINEKSPLQIEISDKKENDASSTAESGIESINVYNVTGKDIDTKNIDNISKKELNVDKTDEDGIQKLQLDLNELSDSEYSNVVVVAYDKAGNRKIESCCIKKDTTAPKGTISLVNSDKKCTWTEWREQVTFGIFKYRNAEFTISYEEDGSGLESAYSYITESKESADKIISRNDFTTDDWTKLSLNNDKKGTITIGNTEKNKGAVVYVRLVDKAGNSTYIRSDGVVIDGAPSANITYDSDGIWTNNPGNVVVDLNGSISGFKKYSIIKKVDGTEKSSYVTYNDTSENPTVNPDENKVTKYIIGSKNSASILEEGDYNIAASVTNRVGEIVTAEVNVKYDVTAPIIKIQSEKGNLVKDKNGILWINNAAKDNPILGLEVSDIDRENIKSSGIGRVEAYLFAEDKSDDIATIVDEKDSSKYIKKINISQCEGKSFSGEISLSELLSGNNIKEDKEYYVYLVAYDNAGNKTIESCCIKKDTTAPKGTISLVNSGKEWTWTEWREQVTFGIFKKENAEFTISYEEDGSGLKSAYSYITESKESADKIISTNDFTTDGWTKLSLNNDKEGTITIDNAEKNKGAVVYVRLVDKAGNSTYIRSDGVVIDGAPSAKITYDKNKTWTNNPGNVVVDLNGSISGFKEYSIIKKVDETEKSIYFKYPDNDTSENSTVNPDKNEETQYIIGSKNSASILEEGNYNIAASVTNRVGETATAEVNVKYDKTAPVIKVSDNSLYKENKEKAEWINQDKYNDKKAGLVFSVEDINQDIAIETSGVKFVKVYRVEPKTEVETFELNVDTEQIKEDMKSYNSPGFSTDDSIYTNCSIKKQNDGYVLAKADISDGDFYFVIAVQDNAGNIGIEKIHVMQDTKAPVVKNKWVDSKGKEIKISNWNNMSNDKLEIKVLDEAPSSGIKNTEAYKLKEDEWDSKFKLDNLDEFLAKEENKVEKDIAYDKKKKAYYVDKIEEGEYWILIVAFDEAGNKGWKAVKVQNDTSESIIKFRFVNTLDDNADIKDIKLSKNKWINKKIENTHLNFEVDDGISAVDEVNVYISEKEFNEYNEEFKKWKKKNGTRYSIDSYDRDYNYGFEPEELEEGDYYVVIEAVDKAGNKSVSSQEVKKDTKYAAIKGLKRDNKETKKWINAGNNVNSKTGDISVTDKTSGVEKENIKIYTTSKKPTKLDIDNWELQSDIIKNPKNFCLKLSGLPDGISYIIVVAEDNAGNIAYDYQKVKKDTKAPDVVDLSKKNIPDNGWINKNNDAALINMEVTDNNIEQASGIYESTIYRYTGTDKLKEDIENNINNKKLFKKLSYGLSGDKLERTGKIKNLNSDSDSNLPDGDYWIVLYVTDTAGNSNYATLEIKKDITEPTGSISLTNGPKEWTSTEWKDKISFNTFKNDANGTEFRFEYDDTTSKIAKVSYYYTKKNVLENKEDSSVGWREIRDVKNNKESYITIGKDSEDDMNAVIYLKIEDTAGNVSYLRSDGIIFDHHKPDGLPEYNRSTFISVNTDTSSLSANGIYKSVPTVSYAIEDPKMANDTYSGLKTISYKVTNKDNGKTMGVNNVTEGAKDYSGIIDLAALGDEIYNYNDVSIRITATDRAENTYTTDTPLTLSIDTTKPIVNVSYKDSTGAEVEPNGRFFNNDITMVVTVTERNFDADATLFRINGQQISLNGMTLVGDAPAGGNGDGDTHTYEYRFTGDEANDKDYTVEYVSCTDKAGNASDSVITPQTFTVDKVQPTVSANDAAGYSSSELTYTATVVERNFDEAGAKVLVTKRLNGSLSYENREYPVIWSTSGDTHTAALSFAEDGDYSFTITCTDKAGNQQAAVYTSKEFTVDNVDPVLTSNISEENNNIANKGNIDFEYVYTDINSSNESGMIGYKVRTLAGTAVNDWVPEIKNVNVDGVNGYTIKFHDNATATKLKDGIYTIELTVKDKAGREAKDEKQFSVNRHGSAYSYISSSYTGAVILQQYVKEITDDIEVVVMNCDDITQYQVEVWNSLNEQNILKPDEDYTWKKENSGYVYKEDNSNRESGFTMYSCKIKPEVFSNEGTYTVRVSTKDIADDAAYGDNAALLYNDDTNTDNNMDITTNMDAAQADKIEFTVDRTNPEIVIMDIDNNGKYNLDKKFSFDYADANELDDIKFVRKDGDKVLETITYKPSDLKDLKTGNISAVAKEYDGYQTITISATDKAGNTGSASVKVLVTSNLWIKYINNTPLVVATIVVVAAAAGGIFFVLFRRRRRGEQN